MNAIEHALVSCHIALDVMSDSISRQEGRMIAREIDEAERAMVQARDVLIAELRKSETGDVSSMRQTLDQINSILSWLVGLEYPAAGIQWTVYCEARDALDKLCKDLRK